MEANEFLADKHSLLIRVDGKLITPEQHHDLLCNLIGSKSSEDKLEEAFQQWKHRMAIRDREKKPGAQKESSSCRRAHYAAASHADGRASPHRANRQANIARRKAIKHESGVAAGPACAGERSPEKKRSPRTTKSKRIPRTSVRRKPR